VFFNQLIEKLLYRIIKLDSRVSREDLLQKYQCSMVFDDEVLNQAAQTLDEIMKVMFELCQRKCQDPWDVHRNFYQDMYSSFESLVLPASGIHHVHYLMFYICSTKPALYETFTERLCVIFLTPSSQLNIRKSCADYLASFLGRASFVPLQYVYSFMLIRPIKRNINS
jgi:RNA polymerase I-specific transcription initiation factor RRN3